MMCSQGGPVHTFQYALWAPSVCLGTEGSSVQESPDWLTHTAQSEPIFLQQNVGIVKGHAMLLAQLE